MMMGESSPLLKWRTIIGMKLARDWMDKNEKEREQRGKRISPVSLSRTNDH